MWIDWVICRACGWFLDVEDTYSCGAEIDVIDIDGARLLGIR
jgi:hypothetical protein